MQGNHCTIFKNMNMTLLDECMTESQESAGYIHDWVYWVHDYVSLCTTHMVGVL